MNARKKRGSWITIAIFEAVDDSRWLESLLREKKFEVRTYQDKFLQAFLFLCPPCVTFRTQTRECDFKSVAYFLDSAQPAILQKALHCPACGSLRVNYPQMTRKFFLPTLLLHAGIIFRIIEHEAYCENCHHVWNLHKEADVPISEKHVAKTFPFDE